MGAPGPYMESTQEVERKATTMARAARGGFSFMGLEGSQSAHEEQNDQHNDDEASSTPHEVIAAAEAVATASKKENNEKDNEDIHDVRMR